MTRTEWLDHWRSLRVAAREARKKQKPTYLESRIMVRVLRAVYNYDYTGYQRTFISLLSRYKDKLPRALALEKTKLIHSWRPEARERAKDLMRHLVYAKNPWLALMPKAEGFEGKYIPVPLSYQ